MPILLAAFSMTSPLETYNRFFEVLHNAADGRECVLFDGCVLLPYTMSPLALRKKLLPHLQPLDRLFLCRVEQPFCAGKLTNRAKDWLKRELFWYGKEDPFSLGAK